MIRTNKVALGITAMLGAALLTGCTEDDPEWVRQCVERATDIRVDDDKCRQDQDDSAGFHSYPYWWYYHHSSTQGAAVGSKVSGGSYAKPSGVSTFHSVPKTGGFGGFKGSSGT